MSEMIDRVAEAIRLRAIDCGQPVHPVMVRHLAVAAIEAMREPTRAMVNAAWIDYENSPNGALVREYSVSHAEEGEDLSQDTAYEVWQAMVDAATQVAA